MSIARTLFRLLLALFRGRLDLAAENLALRQQLALPQRTANGASFMNCYAPYRKPLTGKALGPISW